MHLSIEAAAVLCLVLVVYLIPSLAVGVYAFSAQHGVLVRRAGRIMATIILVAWVPIAVSTPAIYRAVTTYQA